MRISDWSSDVCSSDLLRKIGIPGVVEYGEQPQLTVVHQVSVCRDQSDIDMSAKQRCGCRRSEEHTSELQSLMRISYAVFCLKKKKQHLTHIQIHRLEDMNKKIIYNNTYHYPIN